MQVFMSRPCYCGHTYARTAEMWENTVTLKAPAGDNASMWQELWVFKVFI
jgi:hypothetical protein